MNIDDFWATQSSRGIERYGECYFDPKQAVLVMDDAAKAGLEIVLIDGYYLTNTTTQPSLENSVDFETYNVTARDNRLNFARNFVSDPSRVDMFFGLTFWPFDPEQRK